MGGPGSRSAWRILVLALAITAGAGTCMLGCGSDGSAGVVFPPPPSQTAMPTLTPPGASQLSEGLATSPTPTPTPTPHAAEDGPG